VRGAVAQAWSREPRLTTIQGVLAVAESPGMEKLVERPDMVANLAITIGSWGKDLQETNIKLLREMGERGVVDALIDGYKGRTNNPDSGEPNVIFSHPPRKFYGQDTVADAVAAYKAKREQLKSFTATPGMERVINSTLGKQVMHLTLQRFFVDTSNPYEAWEKALGDFLQTVDSPESFQNLEALAANNRDVVGLLIPHPDNDHVSVEERKAMITDLAAQQPGSLSEESLNRAWSLPDNLRLRGLHAIAACGLDSYARQRRISYETGKWLADPSTGTLDEKKALCSDPLFVNGLDRALAHRTTDRMIDLGPADGSDPNMQALIEYGLTEADSERIRYNRDRNPEARSKMAIDMYKSFYRRFGLDCFDLLEAWEESGVNQTAQLEQIKRHLSTMEGLEKQYPPKDGQPGACRALNDSFFIRHFGRYGFQRMAIQYEERDRLGPHAFAAFASYDLRSRGLESSAQTNLLNLERELMSLEPFRILRIYEWADERQALTSLLRSKHKYGPAGAIALGGIASAARFDISILANQISETDDGKLTAGVKYISGGTKEVPTVIFDGLELRKAYGLPPL